MSLRIPLAGGGGLLGTDFLQQKVNKPGCYAISRKFGSRCIIILKAMVSHSAFKKVFAVLLLEEKKAPRISIMYHSKAE